MNVLDGCSRIFLRTVGEHDCRLLWEWVNDGAVRSAAFQSRDIPWQDHAAWFQEKVSDKNCVHYIGFDENEEPVGQVRFDMRGSEAEIDISVARNMRGRGLGARLLKMAVEELVRHRPDMVVHAHVKQENTPSLRAFAKAGFTRAAAGVIKGHHVIHFVWRKNND